MNIILLCNRSKPEVDQVAGTIASYGHKVTLSDVAPNEEFLKEFDLGVSWMYRKVLKPEHIKAVRLGIINNHPSYLPHGRGADPSVWSIANGEPAGVSMHWIDEGIDTGPIIAQREVASYSTDTWEDLYVRLAFGMFLLFSETWPLLEECNFKVPGVKQGDDYPARRKIDVNNLDNLERSFGKGVARKFVNTLRARTFPGKPSAYITDDDGKKIYVRVTLEKEV